jgi:hypothetical protein
MPTYGAIRRDLDKQTASTDADAAAHFADKWILSLEEFEQRIPGGRFEQVQWLRSLAKIATKIDRPADENEATARRRLGELCRVAMAALHGGVPDAAQLVREASAATPVLAPRFLSAHYIAERLLLSLGPKACARDRAEATQFSLTTAGGFF